MSEFKKGQRVQHVADANHRGVVIGFDSDADPEIQWDDGRSYSEYRHRLVHAAPLRFEDVRSGDTITVEFDGVTVSGPVRVIYAGEVHLGIQGTSQVFENKDGTWRHYVSQQTATLTAHTPAEPEWHRAKVIKADVSGHPDYLVRGTSTHYPWLASDGNEWAQEDLTNVTIIVDEHGEVQA